MKIYQQVKNIVKISVILTALLSAIILTQNTKAQQNQNNQTQQQQKQHAKSKIQTRAQHGDWKIQCPDENQQQKKTSPCWMTQTAIHEKRQGVGIEIYVAYDAKASENTNNNETLNLIRLHLPLGIYLPPGVPMMIDENAIGSLPIIRCHADPLIEKIYCVAFAEAGNAMIEQLKKGSKAYFTLYEGPNLTIPITVSLKGFTAAYNALIKIK